MKRRSFLIGSAASVLAAPALAQDTRVTTLRFVPQANLSAFDPIWTTATVTSNHGYYVFDTLYGADIDFKPRPQMAEGHETSDDGRRWRIRLRDGLKFHDGTPVRSADCIASLKRWCRRDPYGQSLAKAVEDWLAIDDRTFEIRLTRPFPTLIDALAKIDGAAFIMPERLAVTDAMKQITEMVGSGPYRFVASEYNSGSRAVYDKFDDYLPRQEPASRNAGGKVAHFKRIEWLVISDPATAASALTKGEIDWWERPLPDLQPLIAKNRDVSLDVIDPSGRIALMRLNHLQPPFNDVRIRQAVRLAAQQEDYMRASQGDDSSAWQTCCNLWPRGTPYYTGEQVDLMPQDPAKAAAALKASGYSGQKIVIINPTDFPDIGPLGQVTTELLHGIGMNIDLVESDWGTVIQRRNSREPVEKGGWSIFHTTGGASAYANPAISPLVRGQGEAGWFGWWTNGDAEELAEQWLYAADVETRKKAAARLGRLALEEVATIPLGQFTLRTAYRRWLTGILPGSAPYPWGVRRA